MTRPGTYAAVWRWHFYAGLVCILFVIWLALTGMIYLWRPQIEGWLDGRYDRVSAAPAAAPDRQVAAAIAAVPGARLRKYLLPDHDGQAARILVTRDGIDRRVYLDPATLAVRGVETEETRPFPLLSRLHGTLLAGTIGSFIVEIAACWAVTMLLTGLFLWWPRGRRGLAGVLYPRLHGRLFWRDLHAVTGLWVSFLALGLILTGLPWAKGWGSYLVAVRSLTGTSKGPVDWTIGGKPARRDAGGGDAHAGHRMPAGTSPPIVPGALARVIATAERARLAPPVLIAPPKTAGGPWTVSSDAADRPLRSTLVVAGSGALVSRTDFGARHWIDRAIGYGIAVHEGALFGLANQLLGTLTALLLIVLAVSGAVLWWRRRPDGVLGAPLPRGTPHFAPALVAAIVVLGVYMPMFGVTLLLMLGVERLVLRRLAGTRRWLGLAG